MEEKKGLELIRTLKSPEFAEFYTQKIEPDLNEIEALRIKFKNAYFSVIVFSLVIIGALYYLRFIGIISGGIILGIFLCAALGYIKCVYALIAKSRVMSKLLSYWGNFTCEIPNLKDLIWKWFVELIFDHTDTGIYSNKSKRKAHSFYDTNDYIANPNGQYAKSLLLFPDFNRCDCFEVFKGLYSGLNVVIRSMHLKKASFSKTYITAGPIKLGARKIKNIFNGVLVTTSLNKNFKGRVIIRKEKGFYNKFEGLALPPKVSLEDPVFESLFEVYADDQVEARYLLTTAFMERLVFIAKQPEKFDIICSFENGLLNIGLQKKKGRWFDIDLFKPANTIKNYQKMLKDLGKILTVLDTLKLEQKIGM